MQINSCQAPESRKKSIDLLSAEFVQIVQYFQNDITCLFSPYKNLDEMKTLFSRKIKMEKRNVSSAQIFKLSQ